MTRMHNALTIFRQLELLLVLLLFGGGGSKEESTACDAGADCQAWRPALPLSSWGDMVSNHHPDCADTNKRDCPMKALLNACVKNPETMLTECPFSCGLCNNLEKGHVKTCYGVLQNVEDNNESILNVIRKSQHYITRQVFVDDMYANIRSNVCKQLIVVVRVKRYHLLVHYQLFLRLYFFDSARIDTSIAVNGQQKGNVRKIRTS